MATVFCSNVPKKTVFKGIEALLGVKHWLLLRRYRSNFRLLQEYICVVFKNMDFRTVSSVRVKNDLTLV